jgi:hypothetical protein
MLTASDRVVAGGIAPRIESLHGGAIGWDALAAVFAAGDLSLRLGSVRPRLRALSRLPRAGIAAIRRGLRGYRDAADKDQSEQEWQE